MTGRAEAASLQVLTQCGARGEREGVDPGIGQGGRLLAVDFHVEHRQSGLCGNCRKGFRHDGFPDTALPRNNECPGCGEKVADVHGCVVSFDRVEE